MKHLICPVLALTVLGLAGWTPAFADAHPNHAAPAQAMSHSAPLSCNDPIHITEEAERQPGGALYKGPVARHHGNQGSNMLDMKGAHMDHKSRHDGAFFMAPNKMHHLEGKYSERCGFQLHLFNAFTKPISVERFRAFITVIPSHDHEAEITRFLEPNKDRTVMTARVGATVTRPFKIELHLKFPEADDPELFSIHVPALAKIAKTPTKALGNVIDVKIEKRKIVGKQVIRITQEETVTLRWSTDEAVQLHLHGYDIEKAVKPGTQTLMTIKAHAAGRFPVTTHGFGNDAHGGHSKNNLLYLEVYPK